MDKISFIVMFSLLVKCRTQNTSSSLSANVTAYQIDSYRSAPDYSHRGSVIVFNRLDEPLRMKNDRTTGLTGFFSDETQSYITGDEIPCGRVTLKYFTLYRSSSNSLPSSDLIDGDGYHFTIQYLYTDGANCCVALRMNAHDHDGPANGGFYRFQNVLSKIRTWNSEYMTTSENIFAWNSVDPKNGNYTTNYKYTGTVLVPSLEQNYQLRSCYILVVPETSVAPAISTVQDRAAFAAVQGPDGKTPYVYNITALVNSDAGISKKLGLRISNNYLCASFCPATYH